MTDRELLELAAKAAGQAPVLCYESKRNCLRIGDRDRYRLWRPLTDDGDALRLAVRLKIPIQFPDWGNMTRTWGSKNCLDAFDEPHNDNPLAATRRAITRAAAEIGRDMK